MLDRVKSAIERYFEFDVHRTSLSREVRGGFVTFLTMSYILLVNPQIVTSWLGGDHPQQEGLEDIKLDYENSMATATAFICAIGTATMGLVSGAPLAVGPGMSMNSIFAEMIPETRNVTALARSRGAWDGAVTSSGISGAITFALAVVGLSPFVFRRLPTVLKGSIKAGIGLFQCFLALRVMRIVESDETELLHFVQRVDWTDHGPQGTPAQFLFAFTLALTSILYVQHVQAALLISIAITTVFCWIASTGGVTFPTVPVQVPTLSTTFWSFDGTQFGSHPDAIGSCVAFVMITLFDVGGALLAVRAVTMESDLAVAETTPVRQRGGHHHHHPPAAEDEEEEDGAGPENEDEQRSGLLQLTEGEDGLAVPSGGSSEGGEQELDSRYIRKVYATVGAMSVVSAALGGSPCTVFLECLAGVASGARTGFSSLVTAFLFLVSVPFVPLFRSVPYCAAVPALVIIGCFMMSSARDIPWDDVKNALPAFLTIAMMPFTASITPGIVIGIVSYAWLHGVDYLRRLYVRSRVERARGATMTHS